MPDKKITTKTVTAVFPRYKHDCTSCLFLGQLDKYDLYICPKEVSGPTPVCRYGNEGWEYKSGMPFADQDIEPYATAKRRAIAAGLLLSDEPVWNQDQPLPEDAEIAEAQPVKSGRHATYIEAMRLVGAKHSKGALVSLMNWLLLGERDSIRQLANMVLADYQDLRTVAQALVISEAVRSLVGQMAEFKALENIARRL